MFVCVCKAVTREEIDELMSQGITHAKKLAECSGAGSDCGSCLRRLQNLVDKGNSAALAGSSLTPSQSQKELE